ncbi:MAG: proteasome assembly chaperone family protein [ANME-2 cluster archaeon]|nr:proteasome assembly chaperone family protein [ANME-2 cluster archaeon]
MKETIVKILGKVELKDPIMIEGLPGVGHVGKLVAEHMVEELDVEKVVEIYSPHFPPQVFVNDDFTVHLVKNEIYACKSEGKQDMLIVVGDHQSATNEGHYEISSIILDIAEEYGVTRIYTLGGYVTGQLDEKRTVLGAVNNIDLVEEMKEHGVVFKLNEPAGGIVGVSGLLLGMGGLRNMDAVCLMGTTSGYLVDPKSAQAILAVISSVLDLKIDVQALENRAKDMERIIAKIVEMEQMQVQAEMGSDDDLRYIG